MDNTFASPLSQQPLALGADIVYHSATKYLAGHSDTVSGVLATSRDDLFERLKFLQNAIGAVPGPFDCFLVLRGLRTLALRMERHAANGRAVAEALAARDDVDVAQLSRACASGRHAHPQAALAARQMRYCGGMVSFVPAARDGRSAEERARRFAEGTRIFALAESLGGVESLVEIPAVMTHGSVANSPLEVCTRWSACRSASSTRTTSSATSSRHSTGPKGPKRRPDPPHWHSRAPGRAGPGVRFGRPARGACPASSSVPDPRSEQTPGS